MKTHGRISKLLALTGTVAGCTGQVPGSFRYLQQAQTFSSQQQVNTKIDMLWVVDNSASMDAVQEKLRNGVSGFAQKYMKPYWDIRIAVITTDTYMANPAFSSYLATSITGTAGTQSAYIASRLGTYVNHSSNPTLVDTITGNYTMDLTYRDIVPLWGPNYAKLTAGVHDGPITGFCQERLPHFFDDPVFCGTRDAAAAPRGVEACLRPGAGETSIEQCVNTTQNDTVRSGYPIVATKRTGADLAISDTAWTQTLVDRFMVNVTTGSVGHGSERGFSSLLQFISDNEAASSTTQFFRAGATRAIVFVSDEDDQTMAIPSAPAGTYNPYTNYACDQAGMIASNVGITPGITTNANITGTYCCTGGACRYGEGGITCDAKDIDGHSNTISICPKTSELTSVTSIKDQVSTFFTTLDAESGDGTFFSVAIVPLTWTTVNALQSTRVTSDAAVGVLAINAVDRGDRYMEFGTLVGNGSLNVDIGESSYASALDQIGTSIVNKKSIFTLDRAPTSAEEMTVQVIHADGTTTTVSPDLYSIVGRQIIITSQSFVLEELKFDDVIDINYQPKTAY